MSKLNYFKRNKMILKPRATIIIILSDLRHSLTVFGFQALLGLLKVGMLVLIRRRLQVTVYCVRRARRSGGHCRRTDRGKKVQMKKERWQKEWNIKNKQGGDRKRIR